MHVNFSLSQKCKKINFRNYNRTYFKKKNLFENPNPGKGWGRLSIYFNFTVNFLIFTSISSIFPENLGRGSTLRYNVIFFIRKFEKKSARKKWGASPPLSDLPDAICPQDVYKCC